MVDLLIWAAIAACFLTTLLGIRKYGLPRGAWFGVLVAALIVPVWFIKPWRSLNIDPRAAAGLALLLGLLLQRAEPRERPRWLLLDTLMLLTVLSQIVSQLLAGSLGPLTAPEILKTYALPYFVGRLFLRSPRDLLGVLPVICKVTVVLSAWAIVEAFTKTNLVADLLDKTWYKLDQGEGYRWGLKRAQGPLNHPIYLGLVLAMLLPWLIEAYRASRAGWGPRWWRWTPFLAGAALVCTVSRAAQIAAVCVLAADFFFRNPRWRALLLAGGITAAGLIWVNRDEIIELLSSYAGEEDSDSLPAIINGQPYEYSGTRHRELLAAAYAEAIEESGAFGYGVELNRMPRDPEMDGRFASIDDHYLLHMLRYGKVGLAVFIAFALGGLWCFGRAARDPYAPGASLAAGLFGAFLGVAVVAKGVSMEVDFQWLWLFTAGVAARMHLWRHPPAPATTRVL